MERIIIGENLDGSHDKRWCGKTSTDIPSSSQRRVREGEKIGKRLRIRSSRFGAYIKFRAYRFGKAAQALLLTGPYSNYLNLLRKFA